MHCDAAKATAVGRERYIPYGALSSRRGGCNRFSALDCFSGTGRKVANTEQRRRFRKYFEKTIICAQHGSHLDTPCGLNAHKVHRETRRRNTFVCLASHPPTVDLSDCYLHHHPPGVHYHSQPLQPLTRQHSPFQARSIRT